MNKKKRYKNKTQNKASLECLLLCEKVKAIFNDPQDVGGCYTGTCAFGGKPEQDADDL